MTDVVSLARQVIDKVAALKSNRLNFEKSWQEISELVLPRKADFTAMRTAGAPRTRKLFETTAVNAAEMLAAGLHGLMTNPAGKWFALQTAETSDSKPVRQWLERAEQVIADEIARPAAAFATNIHEVYLDLAVLGTAGLYVGWNEDKDCLLFQSRFLGELFIAENVAGQVDEVYRVFRLPVSKIVKTWGEDVLPERLRFLVRQGKDEDCEIIHAVVPNPLYEKDSVFQKPMMSAYVLTDTQTVLFSGGFDEMPLFVVRWSKASGEVYGRSPAFSALPDIKMLQEMMRETLIAAQLANRPPVLVRDDDQFSPLATVPGGVIRYNGEPPKPFSSGANSGIGLDMMNEIRARLRTAFYNDVLVTTKDAAMTATEVLHRNEEKMRLLGPVFGRIQTELLGPMMERVFGLLIRHGKLPPLPDALHGKTPAVSYLSPLTMVQRQVEAQAMIQTLELAEGFLRLQPDAAAVFDVPKTVRKIAAMYGVSDDLIQTRQKENADV